MPCAHHLPDRNWEATGARKSVAEAVFWGQKTRLEPKVISTTMAMLDQYVPAFLSVIYGNEEPKDAIAYVEAASCPGEQAPEGEENGEE